MTDEQLREVNQVLVRTTMYAYPGKINDIMWLTSQVPILYEASVQAEAELNAVQEKYTKITKALNAVTALALASGVCRETPPKKEW